MGQASIEVFCLHIILLGSSMSFKYAIMNGMEIYWNKVWHITDKGKNENILMKRRLFQNENLKQEDKTRN